jgi:hypothetical protein
MKIGLALAQARTIFEIKYHDNLQNIMKVGLALAQASSLFLF